MLIEDIKNGQRFIGMIHEGVFIKVDLRFPNRCDQRDGHYHNFLEDSWAMATKPTSGYNIVRCHRMQLDFDFKILS